MKITNKKKETRVNTRKKNMKKIKYKQPIKMKCDQKKKDEKK